MTSGHKGWAIWGAAALLVPAYAHAQDAAPPPDIGVSTPPELRDFRLDPPPPRPEPQPEVIPSSPPAPTPTPQPEPEPVRETVRQPERRSETRPVREEVVSERRAPDSSPASAPTLAPLPTIEPGTDTPPGSVANAPAAEAGTPIWWWLAAALGLLGLIAGLFLLRRRRSISRSGETAPQLQPSPPTRFAHPKPSKAAAPRPPAGQSIIAEFKPEAAQLSIASLAVTGRLTLINTGDRPVENLIMRSHMMSAQPDQNATIEAFHDDKGAGSIQALGTLARSERIEAVVEIRLPRSELASFCWTEREFVAPIVLVNISGSAADDMVDIRLSHLIGRAGSDAAARMKPLAVDRGPKRFTGVSARPLFA